MNAWLGAGTLPNDLLASHVRADEIGPSKTKNKMKTGVGFWGENARPDKRRLQRWPGGSEVPDPHRRGIGPCCLYVLGGSGFWSRGGQPQPHPHEPKTPESASDRGTVFPGVGGG